MERSEILTETKGKRPRKGGVAGGGVQIHMKLPAYIKFWKYKFPILVKNTGSIFQIMW